MVALVTALYKCCCAPGTVLGAYFTKCSLDPLLNYYYQHLIGWGN